MKFVDLAGQRFGRLLVLTQELPKRRRIRWWCECECGKIPEPINTSNLTGGISKSCGCYRLDLLSARRLRPYESLYRALKCRCKRLRRPFALSYEEFVEFTKTTACQYCGSTVAWSKYRTERGKPKGRLAHNLDRRDSSRGYSKKNCVVCCGDCNEMKMDRTPEIFISHILRIARHMKGRKWNQ
jgi:hypothetical protein